MTAARAALRLAAANPTVTVQDSGRRGAMRYGVSQSGPMDWLRFRLALALVDDTEAAFEVGLGGASFAAEGNVRVAVTGPGFTVRLTGRTARDLTPPVRLTLSDGDALALVPGGHGVWAYVAADSADFGEPTLGSHATNARSGLGAKDLTRPIPCRAVAAGASEREPVLFADVEPPTAPIALLPGPQHHMFSDAARQALASEPYSLTDAVDRMGYRLEGPRLEASSHDIISDGIVEGAMQVPGSGQPIVQCADRAPTGGYPKIAVVATASLPRLTQMRPWDEARFRWVDVEEASRERRALTAALAEPVPRARRQFSVEFLASNNLIGGVWPEP